MLEPFESRAHLWTKRVGDASEEKCMKTFGKTPSELHTLERFLRAAPQANPPIAISSLTHEAFQRACSQHLFENEDTESSVDLNPQLAASVGLPIEKSKILPIPPPFVNSDPQFERQDPQTVHSKFEPLPNVLLTIGGNLFQLRELIDYWLPRQTIHELKDARLEWPPSLLLEQTRLRIVHQLDCIEASFIENLQTMTKAIVELREGAFGGRLNTNSIECAKKVFETLGSLRIMVVRFRTSAADRAASLTSLATWMLEKFLQNINQLKEPYQAERFGSNEQTQAQVGELFRKHREGMEATIRFASQAVQQLSSIFLTATYMGDTIIESFHKIMLDVYGGLTSGEFLAGWAKRWEFASVSLLLKISQLPAINDALVKDFSGVNGELDKFRGGPTLSPFDFRPRD
ncbi:hypothetical protein O181_058438 [Austropuccinia psidii MF-1]|uniref:Exocyst complex component SEC5 n=1 Tax=Austropuccinia psidii MF-1 TaxID=1389203 RepID=A0A9Q3HVI2_9BASI|nr:hypothetical protein [Austropuccinia psidii MF-1]